MTSHAAPAAEMLIPPASQPAAPETATAATATTAAPALSRGTAALDWIAPVRVWQTVAWEAATLAVAAGYGHSALTEAVAYAGAGALVGMSSLRVHGRCLGQWADTQGRYQYRRLAARRRADAEAAAAVAPLAALLPDLGLGGYIDRAGNRVGLAASDGGWVAAVRLGPTVEPDVGALLAVLREAFADTTIPLASAQLVVWTAAGPGASRTASDPDPGPGRPGTSQAAGQSGPNQSGPDQSGANQPALNQSGPSRQTPAATASGAGGSPRSAVGKSEPVWPGPDPADLTATVDNRVDDSVMPPGGFPSQALDTTVTLPVMKPADLDMTVTLPAMTPSALAAAGPQPSVPPLAPTPSLAPMRVYWLALRYRPGQAPHAALARGGGELGAARAVAGAALGLVSRLDSAGYPADALDQFELGQELLVALNAGDPTPSEVRESWRDWSTGHLQQVCFEPHRSLDPAGLLERWAPGAAFTCSSYTFSRTPRGRIRGTSALRVAAHDVEALESPVPAVRANGRHQEFVLRTLPLAVH